MRAHEEVQKSETKAEASGENRQDLISAEGLSTPQPGPGSLVRCNLTSRATLSLCQWTSIFGDRSPRAVTGLRTLTGMYREKTPYTSDCTWCKGQSLSP